MPEDEYAPPDRLPRSSFPPDAAPLDTATADVSPAPRTLLGAMMDGCRQTTEIRRRHAVVFSPCRRAFHRLHGYHAVACFMLIATTTSLLR